MREYIKNKFLKESDKAKHDLDSQNEEDHPLDSLHHPDGNDIGEQKMNEE